MCHIRSVAFGATCLNRNGTGKVKPANSRYPCVAQAVLATAPHRRAVRRFRATARYRSCGAVKSITLAPAEILGISTTCGTLEDNKDATFIITSGDLLDMKTSIVEEAYIQGRKISLDNIQHQLYLKYKKKYGIDQ